jgi:Gpi18-like mannosyltransferase
LNIALNVVSAFGAVALGVVLLLWTRKPLWCALLVATPQFINLARNAVPDSISTVLVIAALWAVIKEKPLAAVSLLAIATWVRPDTFIVAGICFLWMARKGMISWLYAVLLSSLILGSVSFISHEAGGFTWRMIMVNSFLKRLPAPLEHVPSLSVSEYVRILFGAFRGFAAETAIVIYSFIGIVAWRLNSRLKPLLGICLLTFIIRFFIFPVTDDRFFVWMYLCCGIALIDAIEPSRAMITAHCCPVKS